MLLRAHVNLSAALKACLAAPSNEEDSADLEGRDVGARGLLKERERMAAEKDQRAPQ